MNQLAITLMEDARYDKSKYDKAEPLLLRVIEIWKETLGPEHPFLGMTMINLAVLYSAERRYAEAEPLFQSAIQSLGKSPASLESSILP